MDVEFGLVDRLVGGGLVVETGEDERDEGGGVGGGGGGVFGENGGVVGYACADGDVSMFLSYTTLLVW